MVNAETDEIFSYRIMLQDNIKFFKKLSNNVNFYTFSSYSIIEKNEKNNTIKYIDYVGSQVYNDNSILIAIKTDSSVLFKDDINLYLVKEPYKKNSKGITIFSEIPHLSYKLLALKDCFIFILYENEKGNLNSFVKGDFLIKILDLDLKVINSLNISYFNYVNLVFSELSENKIINEIIICTRYYQNNTYCQIVGYQNTNLSFGDIHEIYSNHGGEKYNNFFINLFFENKIGFFYGSAPYDYFTILQYENKKLLYYKNIKDIASSDYFYINSYTRIVMSKKGIAIL